MQAMYELVGDRIEEIFDAQVVDIGDPRSGRGYMQFPYAIERGVRLSRRADRDRSASARHVIETREPLADQRATWSGASGESRQQVVGSGRDRRSRRSSCRWSCGERGHGRISLQNLDRENAFSDGDVRLLTTLASSLSVALENARLFDETRAERRAARAGDHQRASRRASRRRLDMQAMYELGGRQDAARSSTRRSSTSASWTRDAS